MKLRCEILAVLLLCIFAPNFAHASVSKKQALELMKKNGYRWKQTEYLSLDAEAKSAEANSALLPHINAYSREFAGRINQVQYGFSDAGSLSVFAFGETGIDFGYAIIDTASKARLQAARENEKISANTSKQYQSDLTFLMLFQYLNVQKLKKSLAVIDANLEHDNTILDFAKKRIKTGAGISLDLKRAQGLMERDQFRRIDAKTSLYKACQELGVTLGQPNYDCDLAPLSLHVMPEEKLNVAAPKDVIQSKPDILAAKYSITGAERLRDFADKGANPKLELFGTTGVSGEYPIGGSYGAWTGVAGVQVTFPLFDGHFISGQVQEQSAKVLQATAQEQQLEAEDSSQIRVAISQVKDAKVAVDISYRNIDLAQDELTMSTKKFAMGSLSSLELSNSQVNFMTAMDMNVQAIFAYEMAKVGFFKATGQFDSYFDFEEGR